AAEAARNRARPDAGARAGQVDGEAAVAPAAADRLHDDAVGTVAGRADRGVHGAVHRAAGAPGAARAAHADGDGAVADTGAVQGRGHGKAAVASAAAHALEQDAERVGPLGHDRAVEARRHRAAV